MVLQICGFTLPASAWRCGYRVGKCEGELTIVVAKTPTPCIYCIYTNVHHRVSRLSSANNESTKVQTLGMTQSQHDELLLKLVILQH